MLLFLIMSEVLLLLSVIFDLVDIWMFVFWFVMCNCCFVNKFILFVSVVIMILFFVVIKFSLSLCVYSEIRLFVIMCNCFMMFMFMFCFVVMIMFLFVDCCSDFGVMNVMLLGVFVSSFVL